MGVFNGAEFLQAQLDSIAQQTYQNWHLICSDDHSTDASVSLIQAFSAAYPGKVSLRTGPGKGFAANFLSLIAVLPTSPTYVAFADQDDIWLPDKIARGMAQLDRHSAQAQLICGRCILWFPKHRRKTLTPQLQRPCSFRNALIENVATGNTTLLNPAAAKLAQKAALLTTRVFAHDWWLYLLVAGAGGKVVFDNGPPQILYRQHTSNAIGAGVGLTAQVQRKLGVLKGAFSDRLGTNIAALEQVETLLTPSARHLCAEFKTARASTFLTRLCYLKGIAPYRQRRRDTLQFWGAASLGLI